MTIEFSGDDRETVHEFIERRARAAEEKGEPNPWIRRAPQPPFIESGLSIIGRCIQELVSHWPHGA